MRLASILFSVHFLVLGAECLLRDRIIGGGRPTNNPAWMVLIEARYTNCGGGLVSKKLVLTAARCFCTIFKCADAKRF